MHLDLSLSSCAHCPCCCSDFRGDVDNHKQRPVPWCCLAAQAELSRWIRPVPENSEQGGVGEYSCMLIHMFLPLIKCESDKVDAVRYTDFNVSLRGCFVVCFASILQLKSAAVNTNRDKEVIHFNLASCLIYMLFFILRLLAWMRNYISLTVSGRLQTHLRKQKKWKKVMHHIDTLSFTCQCFSIFLIEILLPSRPDQHTLPGDNKEEALVQRDPGERPGRRPHLPLPTGIQPDTPSAWFYSFFTRRIVMTHDLCCAAKQEMPKYLRGYHNCSREDMITLGGLLFRVEVDSDRSQFVMIPRMLRQLVPADQIKSMSPEEWKKVSVQRQGGNYWHVYLS